MIVINELLGYEKYKIAQNPEMFSFSIDSLLLANFATINRKTKKIIDFCSGNFPIPMFLTLRTDAQITAIEIQKEAYDLGVMSLKLNNLENKIEAINADLRGIHNKLGVSVCDLILCNPPFFKVNENSIFNHNEMLTIARHEVMLSLEEAIKEANILLKDGGYFAMVHRPSRLKDILVLFDKYNFVVTRLQFVYPKKNKEANHLLVEARKGNKESNLKILEPLYIYDSENKWTKDILKIYNYSKEE